jgi:UDPglucose 6-dehydrogenase
MKVSIYGAGYVGLVSAVCLADLGHDVCCLDVDAAKIAALRQGQVPIYEPGLAELLSKNLQSGRIRFTADFNEAVSFSTLQIIAVGTPAAIDGSVDLQQVIAVIDQMAMRLRENTIIVIKSTVPVGTTTMLQAKINKNLSPDISVCVVSNPEFLKEGSAVHDFLHPDRILLGTSHQQAIQILQMLYSPLIKTGVPCLVMDTNSAEFSKYAANAFLATKISFINEMSQLAEALDADIELVKMAMGLDTRIGNQFLNPGCGFGGSCFPKDLQALLMQANQFKLPASIINAVWQVNEKQKNILFHKIQRYFSGNLAGKVIALWGLAFKPNTDDVRCAPSCVLIERLLQAGATIRAYDPLAMPNIRQIYAESASLILCQQAQAVTQGADVLAIVTEWEEFREFDLLSIKQNLRYPTIFDGRNLYEPLKMEELGFEYFAVGRKRKMVDM